MRAFDSAGKRVEPGPLQVLAPERGQEDRNRHLLRPARRKPLGRDVRDRLLHPRKDSGPFTLLRGCAAGMC